MSAPRLDFKRLRAEADFAAVLRAYQIEPLKDGTRPGQLKALCPFHEDKNPSLKVNAEKNIFHCFVCGAKGNVLEFIMQLDGSDIRSAAKKLASLGGSPTSSASPARRGPRAVAQPPPASAPSPASPETPTESAPGESVGPNPPLSFALKLEQSEGLSAWLGSRGLLAAAIETFGLGQVSARSKSIGGRLAIPIHNRTGELVAYCGRHIGDVVPDDVPKYILPKGFRKDIEVFNLHRVLGAPAPHRVAVLFESYFSVMRHHEHVPALSVMGRTISPAQIALLREMGLQRIVIVFDGDEPGRSGAREMAGALAPFFWTRIVDLPDGVKPHHLPWEDLRPLLRSAWQNGPTPLAAD